MAGSETTYRYGQRGVAVYPVTATELLALAQGWPWTRRAIVVAIMDSTKFEANADTAEPPTLPGRTPL